MTSEEAERIRAFVLCGGFGTRLRSVLSDRPKSMAPVSGVPFLELLLRQVSEQGVPEAVLGTGYMAEQIEDHFRDGAALGMQIRYSRESEPLGTGGAAKLAEPFLSDPVVVLNGDSYVDWNLDAISELLERKNADAVMVLQRVPDIARYGSVAIDSDGRVTEFVEKGSRAGAGLINAGVYLLRKGIVTNLPEKQATSLEREVFPKMPAGKLYGLVTEGIFIDIGIPEDLERAQTVLLPKVQGRTTSRRA
jgi:D-glycero-alpha-D-manno-heptose 1-phosphate guanylyltransferase